MSDDDENATRDALARLGYDPRWLALGLLEPDLLHSQAAQLDRPDADAHTEHYRTAALHSFLAKGAVTDAQVLGLVDVALVDPDVSFGDRILHVLLRLPALSGEVLDVVEAACTRRGMQRFIVQARLIRRVQAGGVDDTLVDECIASGDPRVLEALVECGDVEPPQLLKLATRAATRKVGTWRRSERAG